MLCRSGRSGRAGEHVLPTWLLDDLWPVADGPYTTHRDGHAITKRDGYVRSQTSSARFKLPMCPACNGVLNERFEVPAKPLIRRMLIDNEAVENADAEIVGLWFVKTWLLLTHPELLSSDPGWPSRPWEPLDPSLHDWMINAGQPPLFVSSWLIKVDRAKMAVATRHIPLPTVVVDGQTLDFRVLQFGLGSVEIHLAHHPGWSIDHPLEAEGRALRLWPPGGARLDLAGLPAVPGNEVRWLKGPTLHFEPKAYWATKRPPLTVSTDVFGAFMPGTYGISAIRL